MTNSGQHLPNEPGHVIDFPSAHNGIERASTRVSPTESLFRLPRTRLPTRYVSNVDPNVDNNRHPLTVPALLSDDDCSEEEADPRELKSGSIAVPLSDEGDAPLDELMLHRWGKHHGILRVLNEEKVSADEFDHLFKRAGLPTTSDGREKRKERFFMQKMRMRNKRPVLILGPTKTTTETDNMSAIDSNVDNERKIGFANQRSGRSGADCKSVSFTVPAPRTSSVSTRDVMLDMDHNPAGVVEQGRNCGNAFASTSTRTNGENEAVAVYGSSVYNDAPYTSYSPVDSSDGSEKVLVNTYIVKENNGALASNISKDKHGSNQDLPLSIRIPESSAKLLNTCISSYAYPVASTHNICDRSGLYSSKKGNRVSTFHAPTAVVTPDAVAAARSNLRKWHGIE